MKKTMALILAMILVVFSLAGCLSGGNKETTPSTKAPDATKPVATDPVETADPNKKDSWLCDEKTTLKVYTSGQSGSFLDPSNDQWFWQWMEDYTNVHIEWEVVPPTDFKTVLTAYMSSGQVDADIIRTSSFPHSNDGGVNGMFVDIAPYFDTHFPNLHRYIEENNLVTYRSALTNPDGTMYAISCKATPTENRILPMYNTKWMKELGLSVPTTLEEFTAYLEAIQAAGDLNGNGEADEIPLTSVQLGWMRPGLHSAFGLETNDSAGYFYADEQGVVRSSWDSDNNRAFLAYMNDLYERKLLDNEITTNVETTIKQKVASDRVGVVVAYTSFATSYGALLPYGADTPYDEHFTVGVPLASEYNNYDPYIVQTDSYTHYTSVNAKSENIDLALRWLDVLMCDENALLARCCGKEGEHYQLNENGEPEIIVPEDGSTWSIAELGCGQIAMPHFQTPLQINFAKSALTPWYMEQYETLRNEYKWIWTSVPTVPSYTDYEAEIRDLYFADVQGLWWESEHKFVIGEMDIETDWDAYVKDLKAMGLDELCNMYQSVYNRLKLNG